MNCRTKGVLLIGSLAAATAVAAVVVLTGALVKVHHHCETGFSQWVDCTYHRSSTSVGQSIPVFTTSGETDVAMSSSRPTFRPLYTDVTSWAFVHCPQNIIARRQLCAVPPDAAPAQAAGDDSVTGLPRPKPWFVTTAKDLPLIKAFHVETPLDVAAVLRFYRAELSKRGWTENDGAVVGPDRAAVTFTTPDGPAQLRLTRQAGRATADLSLRKPAAVDAGMLPRPGQGRLVLGNARDEEAVISIDNQTFRLAARVGQKLADTTATGRKSADSPEIDLPPGHYKMTMKAASGAAQSREFDVVADETSGLLVGPAGAPLPVRLYRRADPGHEPKVAFYPSGA